MSNVTPDRLSPLLTQALDAEQFGSVLERNMTLNSALRTLRVDTIDLLRLRRQRRFVVRYGLTIDEEGHTTAHNWIGKVRAKGADIRTYNLARKLRQAGFGAQANDGIFVPEPVMTIPPLRMWLQHEVPGVCGEQAVKLDDQARMGRRIAEAIHKLHCTPISSDRIHTQEKELQILAQVFTTTGRKEPHLKNSLDYLLRECERITRRLPNSAFVGLHRDFYPAQLRIDEESIFLLDLDLHSWGDAAIDIGNFIAHLQEQGLREFGNHEWFATLEHSFLDRYQQIAGRNMQREAGICTTLSLARLVCISRRIADRRDTTNALIELCINRLSRY